MARYIDADKLNEILASGFIDENDALVESPEECNSMLVWAIQEAKGMPTVDVVEVRHGMWEPEITALSTMVFRCSSCKKYSDVHWAFCPRCGTTMDGERREDGEIH